MTIAVIAAFAIGEFHEAAAVYDSFSAWLTP
jgi:hypothetical protein